MTTRQLIVKRLYESQVPLAVHELGIIGVSDNGAATRLSELARDGIVIGSRRLGKPFKEWAMAPADLILPLTVIG